jgi:ABC-2 type transport system permease protein
VQAVGYIFPSDFAIDGLVRNDQLGATIWDVARDWQSLWCLTIIYFALAVFSAYFVKSRENPWSGAQVPA